MFQWNFHVNARHEDNRSGHTVSLGRAQAQGHYSAAAEGCGGAAMSNKSAAGLKARYSFEKHVRDRGSADLRTWREPARPKTKLNQQQRG
jgi:hypothetical protein